MWENIVERETACLTHFKMMETNLIKLMSSRGKHFIWMDESNELKVYKRVHVQADYLQDVNLVNIFIIANLTIQILENHGHFQHPSIQFNVICN